ncbi:MAG: DUF1194 domain-containing protein [Rhodospirillales bacterium]|nr:DUF1194 domain-containing protein [Rhodospirillales bacterium]MBO6788271.1 DUF1194 domain-containing protein [Rhodospirillales bacterium]
MSRFAIGFLFVVALVLPATTPRTQTQDVSYLNLVLAIDASASVNDQEFELQRTGTAIALRDRDVQTAIMHAPGGINVAVVQWASIRRQAVAVEWTHLREKADIDALSGIIAVMPRILGGGNTMIHGGVEFAGEMLKRAPIPAIRQVIDVSGNGHADNVPLLEKARDRLVAEGVVVNGLAIEEDPLNITHHFRQHLIGGPGAFVVTAWNFPDYARAMRLKFLREIRTPIAGNDCPADNCTQFSASEPIGGYL